MAKEAACKSEADYWRKIADLRRETIIRKMTGREGNKNGL
jgi:GH15 family glucan-1,4-alpha-glucosidase